MLEGKYLTLTQIAFTLCNRAKARSHLSLGKIQSVSHEGEKFSCADFATASSWSQKFAVLTNRKLLSQSSAGVPRMATRGHCALV